MIDRVETIEIHGVEPKKAKISIVNMMPPKVKGKSAVKNRSEPRDSVESVKSSSTQNRRGDEHSKQSDQITGEPGD